MAADFHNRRARLRLRGAVCGGFTLTELMIVVALVGVLAAIGIASFRSRVFASKSSEAAAVIQAIRGAEEAYRSENQVYLDVSTSLTSWYPDDKFGQSPRSWSVPTTQKDHDADKWRLLGARVTQPVLFRYAVKAGRAGDKFPKLSLEKPPDLGTATDLWYVIQARADADGDNVFCNVAATSVSSEVYFENVGE